MPKAPGLGLILNQVHYDGYNKKYGSDGLHEAIGWHQFQVTFTARFLHAYCVSAGCHNEHDF